MASLFVIETTAAFDAQYAAVERIESAVQYRLEYINVLSHPLPAWTQKPVGLRYSLCCLYSQVVHHESVGDLASTSAQSRFSRITNNRGN
jgi:hypothetical protein